jgi:hypothetical protein
MNEGKNLLAHLSLFLLVSMGSSVRGGGFSSTSYSGSLSIGPFGSTFTSSSPLLTWLLSNNITSAYEQLGQIQFKMVGVGGKSDLLLL